MLIHRFRWRAIYTVGHKEDLEEITPRKGVTLSTQTFLISI